MFSKKIIRVFAFCVILLIGAAFHVYGFTSWYSRYINIFDEGWISYGVPNAQNTCEASIHIEKWESDWWPWVNTYESEVAKTAALDSFGNKNVGSYGIWIKITGEQKGSSYKGADSFDHSKSKRRYLVCPREVTVKARASVSPMLDSSTGDVEDSF